MKKIPILLFLTFLVACTQSPAQKKVDLAVEKAAVKSVIETLFKSIDDRNIDLLASVFADDGIFMGNDPTEIMRKDTIVNGWAQMLQIPEMPEFNFISEPFIRIQPDGKTAVYVSQYYWELFTPLPLRQTFWLVKKDSKWLIDFFDFSVIPYNEQFPALNAAVMNNPDINQ